ncbi:PLP-dependent transferase [Hesseltinella vesiculosa]|uniref:PLP-dependent transferase n=1 Tax=Hesseltinella vesiculosa TaxID=101127 RepID=A0A1X2GML1_9FUNG|nr:PLP-dependent transferase [Hesseltinella vesiculosa]
MGLAHNSLSENDMYQKIRSCLEIQIEDLDYGDPHGSRRLRGLVADLVNRHFAPAMPLEYNHVIVAPGAGAAVWQLIHSLTDPGDQVLVTAPYYGNFDLDVCISTNVQLVPLYGQANLDADLDLTGKTIGPKCKVLLVTNPGNPHGRCYTLAEIHDLLLFASQHDLHIIFDEVYGLSTFDHLDADKENAFISVLSVPDLADRIDPQQVHVVYGLSKDFGLNGLRAGFIIDQYNTDLRQVLTLTSMFGYISTINDRALCNLLSDVPWIDEFITKNRQNLLGAYNQAKAYVEQLGYEYHPTGAGPFIVVALGPLFAEKGVTMTFELEHAIWRRCLDGGVFVAAGYVFHTTEPGLFRLTYSMDWPLVKRGLDAFDAAIRSFF